MDRQSWPQCLDDKALKALSVGTDEKRLRIVRKFLTNALNMNARYSRKYPDMQYRMSPDYRLELNSMMKKLLKDIDGTAN